MPLTQTLRTTPSHSQKPITSMFLTSTWHTQNLLSHSHQYPRTRPIPVRGILRLHTIFQHLRTSTISCRRLRIHRKLTTPTTSLSRAHPYLRLRAQNPASRYISTLSFLLKCLPGCGFCPPPGSLHHLDMYYLVPVFAAGSGPGIHSKPRHFLQVQWTAHPRNGEPQAPCVQCYKAHMKQARSPVLLVREWKGHNLRPHPRMPRDPPWYIPYAPLIILTLVFQGHKRTTHSLSPTLEVMSNLYKPWRVVPICFSERTTLRSDVNRVRSISRLIYYMVLMSLFFISRRNVYLHRCRCINICPSCKSIPCRSTAVHPGNRVSAGSLLSTATLLRRAAPNRK